MTAEVAVMNRGAIALAADSASTSIRGSTAKIFNTADKLFQLNSHAPVGIMIYGSAEFCGLPWETIVKLYRRNRTQRRATLEDYADDFLDFIASAELFSNEHLETVFLREANVVLSEAAAIIHARAGEQHAGNISAAADIVSEEILNTVSGAGNLIPNAAATFDALNVMFEGQVAQFVDTLFANNITADAKARLVEIVFRVFVIAPTQETAGTTGLVIAGFGEADLYPSLWEGIYKLVLPVRELVGTMLSTQVIGLDCNATIKPFAQAEMVHSFMTGIDPTLRQTTESSLTEILRRFGAHLQTQVAGNPGVDQAAFNTEVTDKVNSLSQEFRQQIDYYLRQKHVDPVIAAIGQLPKDQLAVMAETLVALTSFKRKMSSDSLETVGGDIDVAVISKGDGFVWIKRKHYFDSKINSRYSLQQQEEFHADP